MVIRVVFRLVGGFEHSLFDPAPLNRAGKKVPLLQLPLSKTLPPRPHPRPLALVPIIQKAWSYLLFLRMKPHLLTALCPWNHGFLPTRQASEVVQSLQLLNDKCWERRQHIRVAKLDLRKAFDHVQHARCLDALLHRGVPRCICSAYLRLLRSSVLCFRTPGDMGEETRVPLLRGVPQGMAASPLVFVAVLNDILAPLEDSASSDLGAGFDMPSGPPLRWLFYADDLA